MLKTDLGAQIETISLTCEPLSSGFQWLKVYGKRWNLPTSEVSLQPLSASL